MLQKRKRVMEIAGKKIHNVRLMFRKEEDGSKIVRVTIRGSKKGKPLVDETLPFTEDVYDNNPDYWESYQGNQISVYHRKDRKDRYVYVNSQSNYEISTNVGQRLEGIVFKMIESKKNSRKF